MKRDMTTAGLLLVLQYAGFVSALALALSWLRPHWKQRTIILVSTLAAPAAMAAVAALLAISTYTDRNPWQDFDKAEGYAAAIWFVIFAGYALAIGALASWVVTNAVQRLRRRR